MRESESQVESESRHTKDEFMRERLINGPLVEHLSIAGARARILLLDLPCIISPYINDQWKREERKQV